MFRSYYDGIVRQVAIDFLDDPGYTKQEFRDECDVNVIMRKYTQFGVVPEVKSPGQFGDFTNVPDLLEAHAIVERATEDFAALSSEIRDRFANDPVRLMAFVSDFKNRDEAIKLGLIVVDSPKVEPIVPVVPAPAPKAPGTV